MIDKAPQTGCVVQVAVPAEPEAKADDAPWRHSATMLGAPSFKYFNVAIAAAGKAIEATTKHLAKTNAKEGEVSVVRGLSSGEIAALGLQAGEVKPA